MQDVQAIERDLLTLLHGGWTQSIDDAAFDTLARRLFAYQFAANVPYQKFCQRRGSTPDTVSRTKAEATSSSGGNSRRGNTSSRATTSQMTASTRNGKAVRAITRQRASSPRPTPRAAVDTPGAEIAGAPSRMVDASTQGPAVLL